MEVTAARRKQLLALAFSVLLVAVFATTISPGMAQQVDLRGTSVIRYRVGADVPPGPKQVVKGSRTSDGGCQFRSPTLGVSTAGQRVTATEIAYDPSLCESLIVIKTQAVPPEEMAANREGYEYQDSRKYGPGAPDEYASTVPPAFSAAHWWRPSGKYAHWTLWLLPVVVRRSCTAGICRREQGSRLCGLVRRWLLYI